ncbi:MAG TPA: hypothetical protein VGV69_05950 [Solirubrobacterales bacterium]|nr:hypothetical protein [Solirubrobacterales bacterium]
MSVSAPAAATEKARSAWKNAQARLGLLGPELRSWLEALEPVGEREGSLLLVDRSSPSPCRRCEALVSRALLPLGYAGAKIVSERELGPREAR